MAPLERNTVRFLDNFSSGGRGAAATEQLLAKGYAVILLHRKNSSFPFVRKLVPPSLSAEAILEAVQPGGGWLGELKAAAAQYGRVTERLLSLPFETVVEYLFLLRSATHALRPAGRSALLLLAAGPHVVRNGDPREGGGKR